MSSKNAINCTADDICILCMDTPIEITLHNCGHVLMCTACAEMWGGVGEPCPICRTAIVGTSLYHGTSEPELVPKKARVDDLTDSPKTIPSAGLSENAMLEYLLDAVETDGRELPPAYYHAPPPKLLLKHAFCIEAVAICRLRFPSLSEDARWMWRMILRASVRTIAIVQMNGLCDSNVPMTPSGCNHLAVLAWLHEVDKFAGDFEEEHYREAAGFKLRCAKGNAENPDAVSLIRKAAEEAASAYLSGSSETLKSKKDLHEGVVRKMMARDWFKKADDNDHFLIDTNRLFGHLCRALGKDSSMQEVDMIAREDSERRLWKRCENAGLYASLCAFHVAVALAKYGNKIVLPQFINS